MVAVAALVIVISFVFRGTKKIVNIMLPILLGTMLVIGIENLGKAMFKAFMPVLYVAGILSLVVGAVLGVVFIFKKHPSDKIMSWLIALPLVVLLAISAAPGIGDGIVPMYVFTIFMFSGVWLDSILIMSGLEPGKKLATSVKWRAITGGPQLLIMIGVVVWAAIAAALA